MECSLDCGLVSDTSSRVPRLVPGPEPAILNFEYVSTGPDPGWCDCCPPPGLPHVASLYTPTGQRPTTIGDMACSCFYGDYLIVRGYEKTV